MHGLDTIKKLNDLAAQNAPGAPERALAEADTSRQGKVSLFDRDYAAAAERQRAERQKAIDKLSTFSNEDLISLVRGLNGCPSTLETVLANRLEEIAQASQEIS